MAMVQAGRKHPLGTMAIAALCEQCQEIQEARTGKMLRTEAELISTALFDETPEIPVDNMQLTPTLLHCSQIVFCNAIAICGGAHLCTFKAFSALST